MSELISEVAPESLPILTLEEKLAECRYSFKYPIIVEANGPIVKLIYQSETGSKSGIALKVTEPVRVEFFLETLLQAVAALTNMVDEKSSLKEVKNGRSA